MIDFAAALLRIAVIRARALRETPHQDRGASALEWAIIAAVVVVAASMIGGVIFNIVQTKGNSLKECANSPIGSTCAGGS